VGCDTQLKGQVTRCMSIEICIFLHERANIYLLLAISELEYTHFSRCVSEVDGFGLIQRQIHNEARRTSTSYFYFNTIVGVMWFDIMCRI